MKYLFFPTFLLIAIGCHSQTQDGRLPNGGMPTAENSLKGIHWELREVLRMQLPASYPEERNGVSFKKNYSLKYQWDETEKDFMLDLREKHLDVETEKITTGSRYLIPFQDIDVSCVRIIFSEDDKLTALVIPAKKGRKFTYNPFTYDPNEAVDKVVIGWFDRIQDRTLNRALELWRQLLTKMAEEQP